MNDGAIEESDDLWDSRSSGLRMQTNDDKSGDESEEDRITGNPRPTQSPRTLQKKCLF